MKSSGSSENQTIMSYWTARTAAIEAVLKDYSVLLEVMKKLMLPPITNMDLKLLVSYKLCSRVITDH